MNIINILEGIEKLVTELLLWIIFIPKTLFKIISDPNWISDYVEEELAKKSDRFENYMSPILLFLVSSMVLFIIAEQAVNFFEIPDLQKIKNELQGEKAIFVGLGFLSLPLVFSLATELFRRTGITRKGIQRIFYIQCYYFSPLTLSIFAFVLLFSVLFEAEVVIWISAVLAASIFILFLIVEAKLIAHELKSGIWKAISILSGSIIFIMVVGGIYLSVSLETSEIDYTFEGEAERIENETLPSSGEFSIYVWGYEEAVGDYRLSLVEGFEDSTEGLIQVSEGETFPSTGTLAYGQFVDSTIAQEYVPSIWTFDGNEGDIISITVEPYGELDVLFDVQDAKGTSIFHKDYTTAIVVIGALYVLLIGAAVILGIRSLFRNPKKP